MAVSRFCSLSEVDDAGQDRQLHEPKECRRLFDRWITTYVLLDDDAGQDAKASHPLREARIDVSEIEGKPGPIERSPYFAPIISSMS